MKNRIVQNSYIVIAAIVLIIFINSNNDSTTDTQQSSTTQITTASNSPKPTSNSNNNSSSSSSSSSKQNETSTKTTKPKQTKEKEINSIVRPFRFFQTDQKEIFETINTDSLRILCTAWGNGVISDDNLNKKAGDVWRVLDKDSSGSKYKLDCDLEFHQFQDGGLNINNTRIVKRYLYGETTVGEFGERVIDYVPSCEEIRTNLDEMITNLLYLESAHDKLYESKNYLGVDEVKYSWRAVVSQWLEIAEANSGTMLNGNYVDVECLANNKYLNDSKYDNYRGIYLNYGNLVWSRDEEYKRAHNW